MARYAARGWLCMPLDMARRMTGELLRTRRQSTDSTAQGRKLEPTANTQMTFRHSSARVEYRSHITLRSYNCSKSGPFHPPSRRLCFHLCTADRDGTPASPAPHWGRPGEGGAPGKLVWEGLPLKGAQPAPSVAEVRTDLRIAPTTTGHDRRAVRRNGWI